MTTILEVLESIIGTAPPGYEPLAYVFAGLIGYGIIDLIFDIFRWIAKGMH